MATPFRLKRSAVADRRPTTTDLQLGELALNTHDGFLYAETTGVGSTVSLLTPWREQYGSPTSIYYNHRVGIGSTNPTVSLDVVGDTIFQSNLDVLGIGTIGSGSSGQAILQYQGSTKLQTQTWGVQVPGTLLTQNFLKTQNITSSTDSRSIFLTNLAGNRLEIGHTNSNSFITGHVGNISINAPQVSISTNFSVGGISTFTDTVNINGVIEANSNLNVDGNLDVDGQTDLDDLAVTGISTFSGDIKIQTSDLSKSLLIGDITGSPVNYLGIQQVAGSSIKGFATQYDNASVFENLQGSFHQHLVLGDSTSGNNGTIFGISLTESGTTYERLKLTGVGDLFVTRNLDVDGTANLDDVDIDGNLDVDGRSELDITNISGTLNVSGIATFNQNVIIPDNKKILFGTDDDLQIYHDTQFNHGFIRETGAGGLILASSVFELYNAGVNEKMITADQNSAVRLYYDSIQRFATSGVGATVYGNLDITADLDVDGHTELDNLKVTGVSTFTSQIFTGKVKISSDVNALSAPSVAGNYHLHVTNPQNDVGETVGIAFGLSTGGDIGAAITHEREGSNSFGNLRFYTKESGSASSMLERMRISKEGNIGINSTAPTHKLEVLGDFTLKSDSADVRSSIRSGSFGGSNHSYLHGFDGTSPNGLTIRSNEAILELIAQAGGTHGGSFLMRDSSNDGFGFVNDPTNEELELKSFTTSADNFRINSTGANVSRLDNCIVIKKDGSVSLFHDGVKTFETKSYGFVSEAFQTDPNILVHKVGHSRGGLAALENQRFALATTTNGDDIVFGFGSAEPVTSSNFTERLRIDNGTGNVGIGTNVPKQQLEVFSGAAGRPTFRHTGGFGGLQIAGPQNASGAALMFAKSYDVVGGGLTAYSIHMAGNTQGLHFVSGDPSEYQTKTRLFLNSAGSVGINTSNPRQKFHLDNGTMFIRGDTAPSLRINAAINDTSSTRLMFGLATGANNFFNGSSALDACISAPSTGRLLFGVGVNSRMYIVNSGDVTIARPTPLGNAKLSVQCDTGSEEGIAVNLNQNSGISTAFAIWNTTGSEVFNLAQDTDSTPDLIFKIKGSGESAPVEKVRFDSSGRVLIGTTTEGHPNADNLTIASSGDTGITIRSGTTNDGRIYFSDATSGAGEYAGSLHYDHNDNKFIIFTNGESRFVIDSSGRLLIGTDTEGHPNADDLTIATDGDTGITIRSGTTHNGRIYFSDATSGTGEVVGSLDYDHNLDKFSIFTNNQPRFHIDGSGNVGINSGLTVSGISTFTDQVGFGTHITLEDYGEIQLGEKSGGDLKIYHDPTLFGDVFNVIESTNGNVFFVNKDTSKPYMYIRSNDIQLRDWSNNHAYIHCKVNQWVRLYYANQRRFETTAYGALLTGGTSGIGTLAGPATFHIDPVTVGDNTGTVVIKGNLQVDGTTTTINSTTVSVDDKNLELGSGAANDAAADGGGITIISGEGNKTFQFEATGDNLGSSEHINIATGKVYKVNNVETLSATTLGSAVVNSSLTNLGTLESLSVTGVSTFAGDLSVAENIVHTGDTDTKINFPPAGNIIRFHTNGQERLRIGTNGSVGLGTNNPEARLDIYDDNTSSTGLLQLSQKGTGDASINFRLVGAGPNNLGLYDTIAEWTAGVDNSDNDKFKINTKSILGHSSGVDAVAITTAGNVSVAKDLDVDGHTELDNLNVSGITTLADDKLTIQNNGGQVQFSANIYSFNGEDGVGAAFRASSGNNIGFEAYYNNLKRFTTDSKGISVHNNLSGIGVTIEHNGQANFAGIVTAKSIDINGHTELDNVNISGVSTFSDTVKVGTGVTALTNGNVSIGGTFEIFESSGIANRNFSQFKLSNFSISQHQNTGSYFIKNSSTGQLLIGGGIGGNGGIGLYNNVLNAKYLRANSEGSVEIFHDNVLRFETSGIGATVYGQLDTTDLNVSGITTLGGSATFATDGYLTTTTGITIENSQPGIIFSDTNANPDFIIQNRQGSFAIRDITSNANRFFVNAANGDVTVTGGLDVDGHTELDNLNVAGISTLTGQVGFGTHITLPDNAKAIFGDHEDIQIYNKGGSSIIANQANTTSENKLLHIYSFYSTTYSSGFSQRFRVGNIYQENNQTGELALELIKDGAVNAYYDGVKRFSTSGIGATVHGQLDTTDLNVSGISTFNGIENISGEVNIGDSATGSSSNRLRIGASADIQLYHDSTASNNHLIAQNGHLRIQNNNLRISALNTSKPFIQADENSSVKLYYAANEKISTSGIGATVFGQLDTTDLNVSGIATVQNNLHIPDDSKILMGDNNDFRIYHNPDNSLNYIVAQNNGPLLIRSSNADMIHCSPQGAVTLKHNGGTRAATSSTGFDISGTLNVTGISTFNGDLTLDKNNPTITLSDNNNNPDYQIGNINGALRFQDTTNNKTKFIANTNGRVGIGTDNPAKDFHVVGTSRFEQLDVVGFATFGSAGTRFFHHTPRIEMQGSNTATISFCNATTGTTNSDGMLMGFSSSSQVGFINVNEGSHGFVLKTGGSAQSDERIRVSGVGTFSIRNGTEEMVNARPNLGVELYFNGNKRLETTNTGVDITDTLKVAGISTFSGGATVSGDITVTNRVTCAAITITDGQPGLIFEDTNANPDFILQNRNGSFAIRDLTSNANRFFVNAANGDVTVTGDIDVSGITTSTGVINSQTDIRINNVSVVETALNDAVAMAIALG